MRNRMKWWEKVLWFVVPAVALVGASLIAGDPAGAGSYTPTCDEQPQFQGCLSAPTTTTAPPTTTVPVEEPTTTTVPEVTTTTVAATTTVPRETTTTTTTTIVIVSEPPVCIDNPDLEGCPEIPEKPIKVAPPAVPVKTTPSFTG